MKTSEATADLFEAMFAMQQELEPIQRTKVVKTGKYEFKYAPLDHILDKLKPILKKHGLAFVQSLDADALATRVFHKSGQWIESNTFLNREHANMQGFGSEATYKRRYALCTLLGIVADEDNDAPIPKVKGNGAAFEEMEWLTPRRQAFLADLAEIIKEKHADGNEWGAYEEYDGLTSQEERTAIWSLLPSQVRSSIKKIGQEARNK